MFVSHGDFLFPLTFAYYLAKHLFVWSFQNGAANPDGLIRLFMRMPVLIVFYFLGTIGASYFYIAITFLVCYAAFYYFQQRLLQIKSVPIKMLSALMFAFNPIFLGNIAKLGLVQAVAMLPLSLTFLYNAFEKKNLKWLVLWILVINASFVHPFTLVVNVAVNGLFFAYLSFFNHKFVLKSLPKLLVIGLLALALNAYFILPLVSLGSIDKSVLTQDLSDEKPDYTQLINVATNKDVLESLSLTKSVFVDFSFFNPYYQGIYLTAIFIIYGIMFVAYLRTQKKLSQKEKNVFRMFLLFFLLLITASTTSIMGSGDILKFISTLPGGWMFRSPLKWQLYIPLVLFSLLAISLKYLTDKKLFIVIPVLYIMLIIINSYVMADAFIKLITPRKIETLNLVQGMDMNEKNLVYISTPACNQTSIENPSFFTELNFIWASKNVQVKKVSLDKIGYYSLSSFDYVMTCNVSEEQSLSLVPSEFSKLFSYLDDQVVIYQNIEPHEFIFATDEVYSIEDPKDMEKKQLFIRDYLKSDFNFIVSQNQPLISTNRIYDLFNHLKTRDVFPGYIQDVGLGMYEQEGFLYLTKPGLKAKLVKNEIQLFPETVPSASISSPVALEPQPALFASYRQPNIQPVNQIENGSFEDGSWQPEVGDCYKFDNQPVLGMNLSTTEYIDGNQALELKAMRHVACVTNTFPLKGGTHYLLDISYQGDPARIAGYYLSFNAQDKSSLTEKFNTSDKSWHTYSRTFTTPTDANEGILTLYGYPIETGVESLTRYDGVTLYEIPDITDSAFIVFPNQGDTAKPESVNSRMLNPTKIAISIKRARTPFYLVSKDSYHDKWHLSDQSGKASVQDHFLINNFQNGWYVSPDAFCDKSETCQKNSDGTYDFDLILEFTPQRWFYVGIIISLLALQSVVLYLVWDWRRGRHHG